MDTSTADRAENFLLRRASLLEPAEHREENIIVFFEVG